MTTVEVAPPTKDGGQTPPVSARCMELVWEGKYDASGRRRTVDVADCAMPLRTIERVDPPGGAGRDDMRNMLVKGDNRFVMASLLETCRGSIDLIYIDPPFDIGADVSTVLPMGGAAGNGTGRGSTIDAVAYRDAWGRGAESYPQMMYERLSLMRDLLSERGSLFVHCDHRATATIRLILDELFGRENHVNEIIWFYKTGGLPEKLGFGRKHDTIHYVTKSRAAATWNPQKEKSYLMHKYGFSNVEIHEDAKGRYTSVNCRDVFDIPALRGNQPQRVDFPTQKPEALLERLMRAASNEGDLVADFFCGSGTTGAVAERLGRRWIMADLGRLAIDTTRKRMCSVQRALADEGRAARAFDVLDLVPHDRRRWRRTNLGDSDERFRSLVLTCFKAEPLSAAEDSLGLVHGCKGSAVVHVSEFERAFSADRARRVAEAVSAHGATECFCLAWGHAPDIQAVIATLAEEIGVMLRPILIPREIMTNGRPGSMVWLEVAVLNATPIIRRTEAGLVVDIELTAFEPSMVEAPARQLDAMARHASPDGFDFIDFWAVDFDWHPEKPFQHHWRSYRTRRDRTLITTSDVAHRSRYPCPRAACVKVIDVFGGETNTIVSITNDIPTP